MSTLQKEIRNQVRVIKFRIWNPGEKKMIESGGTPSMLRAFFEHTAILHTNKEMPYQQFTGLLDRLGKEIYEGDILNTSHRSDPYVVELIKYMAGFFPFCKEEINKKGFEYEVIGNIHMDIPTKTIVVDTSTKTEGET